MAHKGDDNFNKDVDKAVKAGSDFSQGGEFAYKALMTELAQDQKKYANDPAKFDELGKKVAQGLEKTGHIDDHMLRWSRDNMNRFDTSGDGKVDKVEMNPNNPVKVSGFETAMMQRLQSQYEKLQDSPSIQPFIGSRDADDAFSQKNFKKLVEAREKPLTEDREAAQKQDLAERQHAQKENVINALTTNNGRAGSSLAEALDVQRGNKPDGEISHGDVKKFISNFEAGAARGDSAYTQANLDAAKLIDSQWDAPLGVALRGQYDDPNSGHGNGTQKRTHDRIDLTRMAEINGTTLDSLYAANAKGADRQQRVATTGDDRPVVKAVSANGDRAYDPSLAGKPVDDSQPPVRNAPIPEARPTDLDNGRPVRRAEPTGDIQDLTDPSALADRPSKAPDRRDVAPTTRGVHRIKDDTATAVPTDKVPTDKVAADPKDTTKPAKDAPAAKAFEAPAPVPDLVMPELKPGVDVAKAREEFAKQAAEHFQARSVYTVRPGQGWDRIARDVLRQEKDGSHTNEGLVVALSDHVAKGNGWEGRLDPKKMLHPGDKVRVMTDEAVKARTEDMLKQFDAKVAEMQKAAAPATDNGDPALFDGKRSGEGDLTPVKPADTTAKPADTTVPADTTAKPVDTTVKPADTTVKPVDTTVVPNPVDTTAKPADTTVKPVDTTVKPVDTTKPELKASTDGVPVKTSVTQTDVAPDDDFKVNAVSAVDQAQRQAEKEKQEAIDYQIKQDKEKKRLAQNNPMESFSLPKTKQS